MLFWLKKTISFWLMPLPIALTLLVLGAWLLLRPKRARLGKTIFVTGGLLLAVVSNGLVADLLVRPLELRYPAAPEFSVENPPSATLADCRYVVVLGGGNGNGTGRPALSQLSTSALGRLVEAVRIARVLPGARLIVSGSGPDGEPTHAERLTQAAVSLGLDRGRIIRIETARDTEEEALAVSRIAGRAPVALVTSAWHMPRAVTLFQHASVTTLPCPSDYLQKSNTNRLGATFSWSPENLERTTWALHEQLGRLWLWLRGIK